MQSLTIGAYLQALSLPLSLLIAWLTFKATTANLHYSLLAEDVTEQIKFLATQCRKIASEVEMHYLGNYDGGFSATSARDSRKRIMAQIKALDDCRAVLNVFLHEKKSLELQKKFDEWQVGLMDDNFPITRKEDRCKEFDPSVVAMRKATSAFECHLADLRRRCLNRRKVFRNTFR